ncbi:Transmembrane protein 234-like protein [Cercospora zeina]
MTINTRTSTPSNHSYHRPMDPDAPLLETPSSPPVWRWVIGFLMVGACWGLTTPFMRKAAVLRDALPKPSRPYLTDPKISWIKRKFFGIAFAVIDLLKSPRYAIPLLLNVTGSVWFFLLIGQAGKHFLCSVYSVDESGYRYVYDSLIAPRPELSLTVPITNSLAFLFTVLGEWWADGKVISRDTWLGMGFVLGGIALCVHSKTS